MKLSALRAVPFFRLPFGTTPSLRDTPPKEGNGPPIIPLLRRGGGGAAGVVFLRLCRKVTDHPVSRFATATPPKEGNEIVGASRRPF